jgi:hypothetical protein
MVESKHSKSMWRHFMSIVAMGEKPHQTVMVEPGICNKQSGAHH